MDENPDFCLQASNFHTLVAAFILFPDMLGTLDFILFLRIVFQRRAMHRKHTFFPQLIFFRKNPSLSFACMQHTLKLPQLDPLFAGCVAGIAAVKHQFSPYFSVLYV